MADEAYRELLQLVDGRAGDAFRAMVTYDEDDWTVHYVRDELATDELQRVLSDLVDRARHDETIVPESVYGGMGDEQASVELHSEAVLLHITGNEGDSVLISLDREVAQGLGRFVTQCLSVVDDG
ncbi:MAG: hypothetical protein ABEH35_01675 [Haloarculaceae archaeon]